VAIISDGTTIADAGAVNGLGSLILIKSINLGSAASNITFIHGTSSVVFDGTYKVYLFVYTNIHLASHNPDAAGGFNINVTTDGSNFNIAKTTNTLASYHAKDDSAAGAGLNATNSRGNDTGVVPLAGQVHTGNTDALSGHMFFFDPANTTFVKHFLAENARSDFSVREYANHQIVSGYANTTSAVTGIQFTAWSGNIDDGTISLYGIKDS